jgi:hypothetical protein
MILYDISGSVLFIVCTVFDMSSNRRSITMIVLYSSVSPLGVDMPVSQNERGASFGSNSVCVCVCVYVASGVQG